jgi:transposase
MVRGLKLELTRIGLEAGPLSQWRYATMRQSWTCGRVVGDVARVERTRDHAGEADCNDARGIARQIRFRPVHCKSIAGQETRALLTARKPVQVKLHDIEMSLRGILREFGLKVGPTTPVRCEGRIRQSPPTPRGWRPVLGHRRARRRSD